MFALLMKPYAMFQVSILLQPRRTVVANFSSQAISVCFGGTPDSHLLNLEVARTPVEKQ